MVETPTPRKPRWSLGFGPELMRFTLTAVLLFAVLISGIISLRAWVAHLEVQSLQNWQDAAAEVAAEQVSGLRQFIEAQQQMVARVASRQGVREGLEKREWPAPLMADLRLEAARAGYDRPASATGFFFTNVQGRQVMTTSGGLMPANLVGYLRSVTPGQPHIHDVFFIGGESLMAFVAPIYSVTNEQLGWAVALRPVALELSDILKRHTTSTQYGQSAIARVTSDGRLQFITALDEERPVSWVSSSINAAEHRAVARPGMLARGQGIDGHEVVALARGVHTVPWLVVHSMDANNVLADVQARQLRMLAAFLLVSIMLLLLGLAIWRHRSAARVEVAGKKFGQFFGNLKRQNHFFETLLNSQPNTIAVLDEDNCFIFANQELSRWAGIDGHELKGRPLADAYGDDAISVVEHNRLALTSNSRVDTLRQMMRGEVRHVLQSRHVPIEYGEPPRRGVLLVEEDVTDTITQREQRERALDSLVETILTLIDQRDPAARYHSVRVGEVAYTVADELGLPRDQREAARMAGRLHNIGKLFVPETLLTKNTQLTNAELSTIREAMQKGCDMVQNVPFDGPVVETLRAVFNRRGQQAYPAAPVVAVANRFVAMVSPRAHRPHLSVEQALDVLSGDTELNIHMALERAVNRQRAAWAWLPKAARKSERKATPKKAAAKKPQKAKAKPATKPKKKG